MTIYNVKSKQLTNNFAVLQTLENAEFELGQTITVDDVGGAFDGEFIIYDLPEYYYIGTSDSGFPMFDPNISLANQVMYMCTGNAVTRAPAAGTITWELLCTWIADADLLAYLGVQIDEESDDYILLQQSVLAANAFCFRRRSESNYYDQLDTSPGGDATLGTLMYGAALWRSRGSLENAFASFDTMGQAPQQSLTPIVKQLLGINRPSVA
jgi:hypothetical protein